MSEELDRQMQEEALASLQSSMAEAKAEFALSTLDELTEEQKGSIPALRALLESRGLAREDIDSDAFLAKWLVAHGFDDVTVAADRYEETAKWRAEEKAGDLEETPNKAMGLVELCVPHMYVQEDLQGRPMYIEATGHTRLGVVSEHVADADFIKCHAAGQEKLRRLMEENTAKHGRPLDLFTTVLDLEGLGLQHRSGVNLVIQMLQFDNKHYPQRLGRVFLVNAPWVMPTFWALIQGYLPEYIKQRIQVLASPTDLAKYVDPQFLPVRYGGTSDVELVVDNDAAIKAIVNRDATGLALEEFEVAKELVVPLDGEAGTTFRWSFQVEHGMDIKFSVTMINRDTDPEGHSPITIQHESQVTVGKGEFTSPSRATLTFKFDNSYSWYNNKNLLYHVGVLPPNSAE